MIKESTMENTRLLDSWKTMKLVDVCIVERGSSPRPIRKYITDDENGVNWIKIGDTKNIEKYIYETNQKITKEGAEKSRFVAEGDFILSNSMSFGKPYIMKTQGYIHDGWFRLKLHDFVDTEYFYQLLSSPLVNDQFHNLASGSVVKNISGDLVKKVILPIPPLPQQKQIVATLDKAFAAIDTAKTNAKQNLQNAKELFESYLQNVFSTKGNDWEEKTIDEVTKVLNGHSFKSKDFSSENSVKSIKITNVGVKEFIQTEDNYLPSSFSDTYNKYRVHKGNLVIALTRTIISSGLKVAVVPDEYDNSLLNQRVAALIPKDVINDDYLYHFFCTKIVSDYVLSNVNPLMQPNLSITDLKKLLIPCPSLQEQKKVVQKLNDLTAQTKKLEAIYIQKIADLEEMKKSVLQKAFSGQLNTIN
jgi:type I restriction enzyme S subunit